MLKDPQIQKKSKFRSKISVPVSLRRRTPIKSIKKEIVFRNNFYSKEITVNIGNIFCLLVVKEHI